MTIGYGHKVTDDTWKQFDSDKDGKLDEQEATGLLRADAAKHQGWRNKIKVAVAPEVETALGSLEFNMGSNSKHVREIIGLLNQGADPVLVADKVKGLAAAKDKRTGEVKRLGGLANRRREEAELLERGLGASPATEQLPAQHKPKQKRNLFDRIASEAFPQAHAEEPAMDEFSDIDQIIGSVGGASSPEAQDDFSEIDSILASVKESDSVTGIELPEKMQGVSPETAINRSVISPADRFKLRLETFQDISSILKSVTKT